MLEKDCNGNPISTFPPCYAFQMIFTALAPKLIQSISRNVRNRKNVLKRLCQSLDTLKVTFSQRSPTDQQTDRQTDRPTDRQLDFYSRLRAAKNHILF